MLLIVHIVSFLPVSVAYALSMAHVLELAGKLRLDRNTYIAVQHT
jgi:hypothetical protein